MMDSDTKAGVFLFVLMGAFFFMGYSLGYFKGHSFPDNRLIYACERELPRNENCKLIAVKAEK